MLAGQHSFDLELEMEGGFTKTFSQVWTLDVGEAKFVFPNMPPSLELQNSVELYVSEVFSLERPSEDTAFVSVSSLIPYEVSESF